MPAASALPAALPSATGHATRRLSSFASLLSGVTMTSSMAVVRGKVDAVVGRPARFMLEASCMQLQASIQRLCVRSCPALLPCCRRRETLQWLGWQLSRNVGLTHIRGREEGREALLLAISYDKLATTGRPVPWLECENVQCLKFSRFFGPTSTTKLPFSSCWSAMGTPTNDSRWLNNDCNVGAAAAAASSSSFSRKESFFFAAEGNALSPIEVQ
ncbi:uncharacterized protein SEPMUDRAFT_104718 [Sphaerulina musiva SO2202]|uniref:Uncharacterized protein n=1 Tax=Sphaerulina musiva (strain SO2202) TaxID=692275 RepID=N1QJU1_SPHMS|nr:uncharacterized protein SEPMUDRAFT_104718 [Sphaerulina musiva SO2202]EMF17470.1 hypothetical protein SEPMUDRAFT_104718 [Sphaerulina musiva SO2202]